MCGIALILSGVRLGSATNCPNSPRLYISIDDLKSSLRRRGPDSLGSKKVFLQIQTSNDTSNPKIITFLEETALGGTDTRCFDGELHFIGATLQLRGVSPIVQPLVDQFGNVLAYNGEIFGGIDIDSSSNDAMVLLEHLARCCSCDMDGHTCSCSRYGEQQHSVVDVLSKIKGPWAMAYWQNSSKTLWFGRDAFGRRSLLVHWPSEEDPRFFLSSVSPMSSVEQDSAADCDLGNGVSHVAFWEELPCGIYSIAVDTYADNHLYGELKKHDWRSSLVKELVRWERIHVEPAPEGSGICQIQPTPSVMHTESGIPNASNLGLAQVVLNTLKESVMRRTAHHLFFEASLPQEQRQLAPVAVLFSGGLDSMIIAALLDQCLDPQYEVDLLNVSFDGSSAPDRISGRSGLKELRKISPSRRWRLVEIDADLSSLTLEMKHVMSLIHPANTYMDLNIGMALWLASSGNGWVYEGSSCDDYKDMQQHKYKSYSRVVLVGSGADEQCAGYGRHKTKFKHGSMALEFLDSAHNLPIYIVEYLQALGPKVLDSWIGLDEEMRLDMQRIWKRNLGRDDRCIADCGKEARFPFLDEDVIRTLLDIPLWKIADLEQQSGIGDKKILREVARLLGLNEASALPKRAIQFGSRIARESNRKNFGSNRAANLLSAGSVTIDMA